MVTKKTDLKDTGSNESHFFGGLSVPSLCGILPAGIGNIYKTDLV